MSLESFPDAPPEESPALAGRRWLLACVIVLLALAVAYGAAAWWFGERVARGTTVSGVAIGGQTADQARETLSARLDPKVGDPLSLTSGVGTTELVPQDIGLALDLDATVDSLVGVTLDPTAVWHHLAGGARSAPSSSSTGPRSRMPSRRRVVTSTQRRSRGPCR